MNQNPSNTVISIQKLFDKKHFREILQYNLDNLNLWKKTYPNHEDWIRKVIKRFIEDSYNRIAFGGFYYDHNTDKKVLCCSVILKKNPYTPYLEIKNLIVFKHPKNGKLEEYKEIYEKQLIKHIKKFAEQRGYPRLATELSIKNKDTKDLIKIFLEEEFVIAGRQINRYGRSDEIYFLTTEINEVYGYDPYDNKASSEWILSKYLKSNKLKVIEEAVEIVDKNKSLKKDAYMFHSGEKYDGETKSKFNSKNCLLIIEEYFKHISEISQIDEINKIDNSSSNFFVFDFSTENLFSKNFNPDSMKMFDREELEDLMYDTKEKDTGNEKKNKLYRFPHNEIGGLLLISNPARFPFDKAAQLEKEGKSAIYIKLGALGRSIEDNMPLIFAYYPEDSNRSKLEVWGIAELSTEALPVDLEKLREDIPDEKSASNDGDLLFENSDGDLLFEELIEKEDCKNGGNIEVNSILWSKSDFDKHNAYNATKRVICFQISSLKVLNNSSSYINVEDILDEQNYLDEIENVFDFYLSKNEVKELKSKIEELYPNPVEDNKSDIDKQDSSISESENKSLNILFVAANPTNLSRTQTDKEYNIIKEEIALGNHKDSFKFLEPQMAVKITQLIRAFLQQAPDIIHFSGHGNTRGIVITKEDNTSQFLSLDMMIRLFKPLKGITKYVILNSCYSAQQAEEISKFGMYVIGNNLPVENDTALSFSKGFYAGLSTRKNLDDAINSALIVIGVESLQGTDIIEVWKDGNKLEI